MSLSLCGFVVFTTGCFVSSHVLLFVLLFFVFFSVLLSTVITSLGEERPGLCASRAFVYSFYKRRFLSFFSSSWCQGLTMACDCGTPWTFLLTFTVCFVSLFDCNNKPNKKMPLRENIHKKEDGHTT